MRARKAVFNTIAATIMQIVTFVVGLILPRLIIDSYGSSINGLRASITQFISYLYIIELGLGGAIIYSLYKPLAINNVNKINSILSAAKKSYNQIGFYFSGLVTIMILIYPLFVYSKNDIKYFEVMVLVFAIGCAGIINYFTAAKYNVLLIASQKEYVISFIRIIYLVINTIIMIVLINNKINISLVYLISLISNIVQILIIIFYTKKMYSYINFYVKPDIDALSKRYDVIVHQISGMVVFGSPIVLLTLFCSLRDVSVYSVYALVFTGINLIVGVFNSGFTASFGQIIAQKDSKTLKNSYSQYELLYYMILTFVYSCVIILGTPFIKIYTVGITDINYVDTEILILFTIIGVLNNWKIPQSTIIISAGHFKETRHRAITEAIITIISSTILVVLFGLKGALLGSIIGLGYRSIDLLYSSKITGVSFKSTFWRLIRVIVTGSLVVTFILILVPISPNNLVMWIKSALVISIWVGSVVFIVNFIFEREAIIAIILRFYKVFKL